ncbi:hypothetical protein [Streptomyces hokutonensis]|uniref:hypothetical protein n=1 Tax=Streptomyces hokutonensis TaxID=1306990 RepID=UPI00036AB4A9|nr:hypothetical protein [Streptomyces hokutonensis]
MSRRLTTRLLRLEQAAPKALDNPECRHHGQACRMGRDWPQPYVHDVEDDLAEFITEAHRACGRETEPTRRERWEIHVHELVPAAEIEQRNREVAELIREVEVKNERILAELTSEDSDGSPTAA